MLLACTCFPLPPSLLGLPPPGGVCLGSRFSTREGGKEDKREGKGVSCLCCRRRCWRQNGDIKALTVGRLWLQPVRALTPWGEERSGARRTAAEAGQAQTTRGSPWATPMRGLSAAALCWSYSCAEGSLYTAGWAGLQRCRSL